MFGLFNNGGCGNSGSTALWFIILILLLFLNNNNCGIEDTGICCQ